MDKLKLKIIMLERKVNKLELELKEYKRRYSYSQIHVSKLIKRLSKYPDSGYVTHED